MRLLSTPAIAFGVLLAIIFFKIYGVATRPDVPTPVALVVGQFAPGVEIGAKVYDVRHHVGGLTYVRHLGYVGVPGDRETNLPAGGKIGFAQVRLLLDEQSRSMPHGDQKKARIDAVEIVSTEGGASSEIANALAYLFRTNPLQGCVTTAEGTYRDVQVWKTRNERGGVALVGPAAEGGSRTMRYGGPSVTSVVAFTGKFAGSETMRANYHDAACTSVSDTQ